MHISTSWMALGLGIALLGCSEPDVPAPSDPDPSKPESGATAESDATGSMPELQRALEEPDPFSRAGRLAQVLPTLGEDAIPQLRKTLDRFRPEIGSVEFDLMLRHWANLRPEEAAGWALDASPRLYRLNAIRTAIEVLARHDPPKALALILPAYAQDTEKGTIAQFALVDGWFSHDRAEVMEYIESLGPGISRQRALHAYAAVLAAADGSDAAIQWAVGLQEDDELFKQEAFQQLMSSLAWVDPAAATRFCEAHCDGPYGTGLRNVLVRAQLREGEPGGEIVEWVARTSAAETDEQRERRDATLLMAYAHWAFADHEAAIAWMEDKVAAPDPEPWLPALYNEFARQLAAEDPVRALEWAQKVEDEGQRTLTLVRIARYWRMQDEEAAEAWLADSPLDEEQREQARNPRLPHYLPRTGNENPARESTTSPPTA